MNNKIFIYILFCFALVYSSSAYWCFQGSANTSNISGNDGSCSLNFSGSYSWDSGITNPDRAFDGSVSTYATKNGVQGYSYIYVNISKALNSYYSLLQVLDSVSTAIDSPHNLFSCWDGSSYIDMGSLNKTAYTYNEVIFQNLSFPQQCFNQSIIRLNMTVYRSGCPLLCEGNTISEINYFWGIKSIDPISLNVSSPQFGESFVFNISGLNSSDWVNLTVLLPNKSLIRLNTSYLNGNFISQSLTAVNGTYFVNATSIYNNLTYNFTLNDTKIISPSSYSSVVQAGQNFTFNISIASNSLMNLTFLSVCNYPSNFTNCSLTYNPSVINSTIMQVNIVTNASNIDYTYIGSITITRMLDGWVDSIPLYFGIATNYGKPVIINSTSQVISISNSASAMNSLILMNNGTNNLTNCVGSFDGTLSALSYYYSFSNLSLTINQSKIFNVTFSTLPIGTYSGYLQVDCVATSSGSHNTLNALNQPLFVVTSFTPSSGGGGGGSIVIDNTSLILAPNILDTYYIITSLDYSLPKIFNYTFIASKNVDSCSINNNFTCIVDGNNIYIFKDYTNITLLTDMSSPTLEVTAGSSITQKDLTVRLINLAYYIPFQTSNYPQILTDLSIIAVKDKMMVGIYIFPFIIVLAFAALIYLVI